MKAVKISARNEEIDVKVEEVKEAIERLPDGYRVILSLYLLEGYDHDEIAEILSITAVHHDLSFQEQNRNSSVN